MKNIIFFGDSYCATFKNQKGPVNFAQINCPEPTYLNLAAEQLGLEFYSFGFAGMSWWYSRQKFLNFLDNNADVYENTEAIVFCHTDCNRPNSSSDSISTALLSEDKKHTSQAMAYKMWQLEIKDTEFQRWAQDQWFKEIRQKFGHKKTIHFNVSFDSVTSSEELLPGIVFSTPLINISLGEFVGSDDEVFQKSTSFDQRPNHFNLKNNQAMANLIADNLKNYKPCSLPVDLIKYNFDQPNPNAHNWPNSGWGTC